MIHLPKTTVMQFSHSSKGTFFLLHCKISQTINQHIPPANWKKKPGVRCMAKSKPSPVQTRVRKNLQQKLSGSPWLSVQTQSWGGGGGEGVVLVFFFYCSVCASIFRIVRQTQILISGTQYMNVKYIELEGKPVFLLAKHDRRILTQDLWISISSRRMCPSTGSFPAHFEGFSFKGKKKITP